LKLAVEAVVDPLEGFDCVIAANPPIDLAACAHHIRRPANRLYDRHFAGRLRREVARLHRRFPDLGLARLDGVRSVYDFDVRYTAPRNGFESAEDYYARSRVRGRLAEIVAPGLVIHAEDDPFIPADPFRLETFPANLAFELIPRGGHLGYISRSPWNGDRRWLESRLEAWLAAHWGLTPSLSSARTTVRVSGHVPENRGEAASLRPSELDCSASASQGVQPRHA
jgi:predicted alpha/beta-fold hydrolase